MPLHLQTSPYRDSDDLAKDLLPTIVFLCCLSVLGFLGNSLVCYVFCVRLRAGPQNCLIVVLTVLDLLSCTVALPGEIAHLVYYNTFDDKHLCKFTR